MKKRIQVLALSTIGLFLLVAGFSVLLCLPGNVKDHTALYLINNILGVLSIAALLALGFTLFKTPQMIDYIVSCFIIVILYSLYTYLY